MSCLKERIGCPENHNQERRSHLVKKSNLALRQNEEMHNKCKEVENSKCKSVFSPERLLVRERGGNKEKFLASTIRGKKMKVGLWLFNFKEY